MNLEKFEQSDHLYYNFGDIKGNHSEVVIIILHIKADLRWNVHCFTIMHSF